MTTKPTLFSRMTSVILVLCFLGNPATAPCFRPGCPRPMPPFLFTGEALALESGQFPRPEDSRRGRHARLGAQANFASLRATPGRADLAMDRSDVPSGVVEDGSVRIGVGRTVLHSKFGHGLILEITGDRVTIQFLSSEFGVKKFDTSIVRAQLTRSDKQLKDFGFTVDQFQKRSGAKQRDGHRPPAANRAVTDADQSRPPAPRPDSDFAIPPRPAGLPSGYRRRDGETLASPRLYYGEMVRRAELLLALRPWLEKGLDFDDIAALADNLVRMPRIFLTARPDFFPDETLAKILAFQPFDIHSLGARLALEKNRYKKLADAQGVLFSSEEIHHLLFERLIPLPVVEILYAEGLSKADVIVRMDKIGPQDLQSLVERTQFREKISRRLELIKPPERARYLASTLGVERWTQIEEWMARVQKETGISEQEALRHAVNDFAGAKNKLDAALADAVGVRDVLFPDQPQLISTVRFLFLSSYHQIVSRLRKQKIRPADYLVHINAERTRRGARVARSEVDYGPRTREFLLEPFDRTQGTFFEQRSAEASKLRPLAGIQGESPFEQMQNFSRLLAALFRRQPAAARGKVRNLVKQGRAGIIIANKMIRPANEGGLAENHRALREYIWGTLVAESSGGQPLPLWKRDVLPATFEQVADLGHILVEGPLDGHGFARVRNETLGRFVYPNAHYQMELFYGIPLRIWIVEPAVAYDYLRMFDNETGALRGSYHDVLDPSRTQEGDLAIETDTDGHGEISVGGKRQRMEKGKTTQRVARFGPEHPWERTLIHQRDGLPLACASLQSPTRKDLARIVDPENEGRTLRTFQRVLTRNELNALDPRYRLENLEVRGPLPKIGREWWYRIPRGRHLIDVTRLARAQDGRLLILEFKDRETGYRYPARPPHFVYVPEPDAAAASFRKTGLFHVYEGSLTRQRLAFPTGKAPGDFITEATLSETAGTLEILGFSGVFGDFPGALVEVKFISGEKRYVKFIHDADGNPILTRAGLPVVFDLKNRGENWNWPDLMDTGWVEDIRRAAKALSSPNPQEPATIFAALEEQLRNHRSENRIPTGIEPSVHKLLQALSRAPRGGASDITPAFLEEMWKPIHAVADALEQALEEDVTPITGAKAREENAAKSIEQKRITKAMTVREALQSGFAHVRRVRAMWVPAPGFQVRLATPRQRAAVGRIVPMDQVLEPGDVLTLLRRAPGEPRVEPLSIPAPKPAFSRRQILPILNWRTPLGVLPVLLPVFLLLAGLAGNAIARQAARTPDSGNAMFNKDDLYLMIGTGLLILRWLIGRLIIPWRKWSESFRVYRRADRRTA